MIHLRPISEEDDAFLFRVYASTRTEELKQLDWNEQARHAFLASQFNAQHRYYHEQFPGAEFQLILREDEPIGRLYVDRSNDEIRIVDIALLPEFQRQGIGSALLQTLLAEARHRHLPVRIHVEKFNPAMGLYERLGFRPLEDQDVYLLMEWAVDQATKSWVGSDRDKSSGTD